MSVLIIPAIDLKDGKCVRLRQGRMDDATIFSDDPIATARRWVQAGAKRLHIVDLNGAIAGEPVTYTSACEYAPETAPRSKAVSSIARLP